MSDRLKASAPKASTPKEPATKSGTAATSWLAGFITRAAAGIVYAFVFILSWFWVSSPPPSLSPS